MWTHHLFSLTLAALFANAVNAAANDNSKLVKCDANAVPSTCPQGKYCQATKTFSYCYKKLDGGAECDKDDACKSNICFIAKKTSSGKKGKRTCASLPTSNYALGARCTESEQCKSEFCSKGFCLKPVPAGEKCPKEAGCAELKKGAHCLDKPETFIVYDNTGKKSTKKLTAGHCSYVRNLGEGMKCTGDINCYQEKFFCSKETNQCTANPPKINLPYKEICSTNSQCASGKCVDGKCGCSASGSDCKSTHFCSDAAVCKLKLEYGEVCVKSDNSCVDNLCVEGQGGAYKCGCAQAKSCPAANFCDTFYHACFDKRPAGQYCSVDGVEGECLSDLCLNNTCGCVRDSDCLDSKVCDTEGNICKAPPTDLAYQDQCSTDSQCASGHCVTGKCGCKQGEGSECLAATEYCSDSFVCEAKLAYGESCTSPGMCEDSVCVNPPQSRRGLSMGISGRGPAAMICGCSSYVACENTEFCAVATNLCTPMREYGEMCDDNDSCISGYCNSDNKCGCEESDCSGSETCDPSTRLCAAKFDVGHSCTIANNCKSGACSNFACKCQFDVDCAEDQICLNNGFCGVD